MPYITERQMRDLREILRVSTMETSSFEWPPGEKVLGRASDEYWKEREEIGVNDFIKERTRLWRESWITGPLRELVEELDAKAKG